MASWEQTRDELLKKYGAENAGQKTAKDNEQKSTWEKTRDELLEKYTKQPEEQKKAIKPTRDGASSRKAYEKRQETAAAPIESAKTEDTGKKSVLEQAMEYHQSKKDEVPILDLGQQVEKTDDRTWFQKGALEDGATFKNWAKGSVATTADAKADIRAGVLRPVEAAIDTAASFAPSNLAAQIQGNYGDPAQQAGANIGKMLASWIMGKDANYVQDQLNEMAAKAYVESKAGTEEFIKKDLIDEQAIAKKITDYTTAEGLIANTLGIDVEKNSFLGDKSDALAQSAGQLGITAALHAAGVPGWLVSGVSAYGGEVESALQQGASLEEANVSAAITAAAEVLSEKISGGIKFGGKTLDDAITKQISETISNRLARALANAGVQAAGEGFEEVLSDTASKFGQWLTYQDDKTVEELFLSKEAFDQALEAFIGGSILGGFGSVSQSVQEAQSAPQSGTNNTDTQTRQPIAPTQAQERATAEPKPGSLEWVKGIAETGKTTEQAQPKTETTSTAQNVYDEVLAKGANAEVTENETPKTKVKRLTKVRQDLGKQIGNLESKKNKTAAEEAQLRQLYQQMDANQIELEDALDQANPKAIYNKREGKNGWGNVYGSAMEAINVALRKVDPDLASAIAAEVDAATESDTPNTPLLNAQLAVNEDVRQESITPAQGAMLLSEAYSRGGVNALTQMVNSAGNLYPQYLEHAKTIKNEFANIRNESQDQGSYDERETSNRRIGGKDNDGYDVGRPGISLNLQADESVGAAPGWFDPNTRLQYEYGTLPEGENAVRPDDMQKRDYTGNPVSQTAVTVKGAKVTRDYLVDLLNKDVVEGGMSYVNITNDATVDKAIANIMEKGWEAALGEWSAAVNDGKAGADLVATGALLLNNAAKAGDKTAWLDILHDYQKLGTNTAQGLQAFRILKKLEPMDKLYMARRSIKQMVKDMKLDTDITIDPELEAKFNNAETDEERDAVLKEIQKDVARQLPTTFMEKFTALRYLNMLGNLRTQGRNILGNLTMQSVRSLQNAVGTGLEAIASKVSGGKVKRTRSLTVSKEQMQAASKDFDKMQNAILEGQKFDDSDVADDFARGVKENKQIFKSKALEGYRKATNWAMEKGDVIFARHAYARALAGYLKAQGITETDYSRIDPEIMDDARLFAAKEAQEATFRDTNAISAWVSKVGRRKDSPKAVKTIAEGVVPFRKTPANVFVRAVEYSPLGVADSIVKSVKAAKGDSDVTATKVINSWAKSLTGTGLFGMGMLLASLGFLSAGEDEDENKEAFEDMNGWQNYALVLPDGTNLTIDSFSPAAIPILMGAEMMRLMQDGDLTFADLESALTSLADPMIEMSMLQGVNDAFDNIKFSDNNLIQLAISSSLNYLTQGLTNTLVGQIERSHEDQRMQTYIDPNSDVPTWLQRTLGKVSAKTPGWDYNQIPYINAWGEQEENLPGAADWAYQMLSPSYYAKGKDDQLTQELNRLNDAQDENVYPAIQDKTITIDNKDYNLTADEFVEVATQRGQMQKKLVEGIISSKDYKLLDDDEKAKAIRFAYTYAQETALGDVIKDHPGLKAKWMQGLTGNISEGIIRHVLTGTTEKYTDIPAAKASFVVDLFDSIVPEGKSKSATTIQKVEAVAGADNKLTPQEQQKVMQDVLTDELYAKYLDVLKLKDTSGSNLDTDDYAASYRIYLDEDKKGGKGTKDRTIKAMQKALGVSQTVAKKLYEIYH
jgi:hypothetical protein